MTRLYLLFFLLFGLMLSPVASASETLRVFQFNVWQEGTSVPDGFEQMIDLIDASEADVVTFSEVRNYNDTDFHQRVVAALKAKGKNYNGQYVGGDVGLITRLPILKTEKVADAIMAWHLNAGEGRQLIVCSAHLDYRNYAVYLPRGYDGRTFKIIDLDGDGKPDPVTRKKDINAMDAASGRDESHQAFLKFAKKYRKSDVIYAGDFNEASHLDWTKETKDMFDRHGLVMPWKNSLLLTRAGFVDAFREVHPDPKTHPGMTWPSDVSSGKNTTWTPKADERDRIDFIYYQSKRLTPVAASIAGTKNYFVNNELTTVEDETPFLLSEMKWMSDHKGVIVDFEWK